MIARRGGGYEGPTALKNTPGDPGNRMDSIKKWQLQQLELVYSLLAAGSAVEAALNGLLSARSAGGADAAMLNAALGPL